MMAPYADEIATHQFEKLEPIGRVTLRPRKVNWKNVGDNYSDGLHIAVAHPGLTRLFGATYRVEAREWIEAQGIDIALRSNRFRDFRTFVGQCDPDAHRFDGNQNV